MEIVQKCKDCVFLNSDNTCELNRLKKFALNGAVIQKGDEGIPIIRGRFCSAKRDSRWAKGKSPDDLEILVRSELLVNTELFIPLDDTYPFSEKEFIRTIDSVRSQILKPNRIVIIDTMRRYKPNYMVKFLTEQSLPCDWRFDRRTNDEVDPLDIAASKIRTELYSLFRCGAEVPEDFFANIDEALNDKLYRFLLVLPPETSEGGSGLVINSTFHKMVKGNEPLPVGFLDKDAENPERILHHIYDKIWYLAKRDNQEYLIKSYEEICN
jgi:hypothetical protein